MELNKSPKQFMRMWRIWMRDQSRLKFSKAVWFCTKRNQYWLAHLTEKVFDAGCSKPFGLLEVKCSETKFLVTPLDACSDASFCSEIIAGNCKLKVTHPYYVQIQGQMGITGAEWCDFVIFTIKGISIERVLFDPMYWQELEGKLLYYYYEHFITFAIVEAL